MRKIVKGGPFGFFEDPVWCKSSEKNHWRGDHGKVLRTKWNMRILNYLKCRKMWKKDPLGFINILSVEKYQNNWRRDPLVQKSWYTKIAKGVSLVCFRGSGRRFCFGWGSDKSSMFWTCVGKVKQMNKKLDVSVWDLLSAEKKGGKVTVRDGYFLRHKMHRLNKKTKWDTLEYIAKKEEKVKHLKVSQCQKTERGARWDFSTFILSQNSKKLKGKVFGDFFLEKSRAMQKR